MGRSPYPPWRRVTTVAILFSLPSVGAAQAVLAALVGAAYVAPYVSRLTRHLGDGPAIVREMAAVVRGSRTRIIAASLKSSSEAVAALLAGAHDVTLPLDLILAMGEHELSRQAIEEFDAAGAR